MWSAARKTQARTSSLLSAVKDKTNVALAKTAMRKNSCLFAASPAKVSRSEQILSGFFFQLYLFPAAPKANENGLDAHEDGEILAQPSNR